jgi:hypothetical protein
MSRRMEGSFPEHVRDRRLDTRFNSHGQVVHIINDPDAPGLKTKEIWVRKPGLLGRGGQGQVFLQECISGPRREHLRAVKKIPFDGEGAKRRFIEELKTQIKFSRDRYSQYFVKTLGWYERREYVYIAMEYLPAGDLKAYLNDNTLSEDECRNIIFQVLKGLEEMHNERYAHRDVKPQVRRFPSPKDRVQLSTDQQHNRTS